VAFLRRRSRTDRRPGRCRRTAATALGRDQLARQEDERRVVQRVVSCRARSAPQEGHESRQAQPTHRSRLQRDVDEQNGDRNNGKVDDSVILNLPMRIARRMVSISRTIIIIGTHQLNSLRGCTRLNFCRHRRFFRIENQCLAIKYIYNIMDVSYQRNNIHIRYLVPGCYYMATRRLYPPDFLIIIFFSKIPTVKKY